MLLDRSREVDTTRLAVDLSQDKAAIAKERT